MKVKTRKEVLSKIGEDHPAWTHHSRTADYFRLHPRAVVPRSPIELSKLIGVPVNAVRCYLYRRRKRVKTLLASLPDVKKLDVDFVDKKGYRVNASMFKNYEYVYDSFTLEVKLKAELTSGEISSFPIPNLDDYVKKIKRFSGGKKDGT